MKSLIKSTLRMLFMLLALPCWLGFTLQSALMGKDQATTSWSQLLSLLPGLLGVYYRAAFYRLIFRETSQNTVIGFGTLFSQHRTHISSGVYIGPQCNIGMCRIQPNCLLGSGVHIMSGKGQHNFSDPDTPLKDQGGQFTQVVVGEDTWIGNGALVMANIGKKCVVAAGSVVISEVPDYAIVGGNPAKVLGSRKASDS
ncbi:acyltransferase [Aestuariibacter sp. GS-14]|uniref:acyltransferase n=1 Tax=Aestuariibacter sp. GS-14 TaxID=2590670 RepID=UPI001128D9A0|nr:acyltransferase [Aestuariibacter sp. GS-14]TPV62125.1 acyltransferase [Aestuariibacter sp. GS-14]